MCAGSVDVVTDGAARLTVLRATLTVWATFWPKYLASCKGSGLLY